VLITQNKAGGLYEKSRFFFLQGKLAGKLFVFDSYGFVFGIYHSLLRVYFGKAG
jgi:hypothetical protein